MSQDIDQVKLVLWRQYLLLKQYKKVIIIMILWPINFIIAGVFITPDPNKGPPQLKQYDNNTDNYHFGSDLSIDISSFDVIEGQEVPTTFDCSGQDAPKIFGCQCLNSDRLFIGLVEPEEFKGKQDGPAMATFNMIEDLMQVGQKGNDSYVFPFKPMPFNSNEAMEQHSSSVSTYNDEKTLCVGIIFNTFDSKNYNVSIRYPEDLQPSMSAAQTNFTYGKYDSASYRQWLDNGFLQVMQATTQVIANKELNLENPQARNASYAIQLRPAYTPDFLYDITTLMSLLWIVFAFGFVTAIPAICEGLSKESNEGEIIDLCKSMGLKPKIIVFSRVVQMWIIAIICGFIMFPLCYQFKMFGEANIVIITLTYLFTCQGLGLTVNYMQEMAGWKVVFVYFVILFVKTFFIDPQYLLVAPPAWLQYTSVLIFPSSAMSVVFRIALLFNTYYPEGLQWSNLSEVHEGVSVTGTWLLLLTNMVIVIVLIILGSREKDEDALKAKSKVSQNDQSDERQSLLLEGEEDLVKQGEYEPVTIQQFDLNASDKSDFMKDDILRIDRLTKEFKRQGVKDKNDKFKAVDGLSLSLFKNQILCLLGHNGAGKTTTIQMITGFLTKTSGTASVFGMDLFEEREQIKRQIGICPQHNVLSFKLTVEQNIQFFGGIKNMTQVEIRAFIAKYLPIVDLEKKKESKVSTLSGGQKRKLQLLIAIMGDIKIILLDEPSSGMDPTSRRDTWSFIQELKKDKFIILTTHYMDEADVLGDRIAIMSKGKLKTCGSSLFLKKKYDLGTIIEISQIKLSQKMDDVLDIINEQLPAQILSASSELKAFGSLDESSNLFTIKIPSNLAVELPSIFEALDQREKWVDLNILSYNVRVTSLEEVFNIIGEQEFNPSEIQETHQSLLDNRKYSKEEISQASDRIQIQETSFFQVVNILISARFMMFKRRNIFMIAILLMVSNTTINWVAIRAGTSDFVNYTLDANTLYNPSEKTSKKNMIGLGGQQLNQQNFKDLPIIQEFGVQEFSDCESFQDNQTATLMSFSKCGYDHTEKYENEYQSLFYINSFDESKVEINTFFNMSEGINGPLAAAISQQAVLQRIHPEIKLTFVDQPLGGPVLTKQAPTPPMAALSYVSWPNSRMIMDLAISLLIYEELNGIDRQKLMAGVTFKHTYVSELIFQTLFHTIASFLFWLISFKYDVKGLWLPSIIYIFASPLFNIFVQQIKGRANTQYLVFTQMGVGLYIAMTGVGHSSAMMINVPIEILISHVPFIGLTMSFVKLVWRSKFYTDGIDDGYTSDSTNDPFNLKGCLPEVIGMASSIIVWPLATFIKRSWSRKSQPSFGNIKKQFTGIEEQAVIQEQQRVEQLITHKPEMLSVSNISKTFKINEGKTLTAVEQVSFSFNRKDRFILLGLNGAGKSTTFKMLTAEEKPTSGIIKLNGIDINEIHDNPELLKNIIGYCPQTDPIWGFLTVQETLNLYAKLRSFQRDQIPAIVKDTMNKFRISEYENTLAGNLSGGNKRKLVTAMAMMGNPPIILLDESSAGVDPYSRRLLWKTIREESSNSALVVTTHSMEEAEALGTKMAIMVGGKFKCLGTAQQIKQDYGQGFFIEIKIDFEKINASFIQKNSSNQKDSFINFHALIQHIQDALLKDLGIQEDFSKQKILETFLLKGLLDEFLPNNDENHGTFQIQGVGKVINSIVNIMQIAFKFVDDFGSPALVDFKGNTVHLRLKNPKGLSIGFVFGFVQSLCNSLPIKDFNATQTTLEQVFNSFAKEQTSGSIRKKSSIDALKNVLSQQR